MNPEKVISMCTEKSLSVNDIPGGGAPDFTADDAKRALCHMKKDEFNYCQYVFLLYNNKLPDLIESAVFHIITKNGDIKNDKKLGLTFVISLCRLACEEQTGPRVHISDSSRYKKLGITREQWRWKWRDVFIEITNYLNSLRERVVRHIYFATR